MITISVSVSKALSLSLWCLRLFADTSAQCFLAGDSNDEKLAGRSHSSLRDLAAHVAGNGAS